MPSPPREEVSDDAAKEPTSGGDDIRGGEEETEGLLCPICFEPWSNSGDHYPCCLPCGHLYGMSCIKKWFKPRRTNNKCPQCNVKCAVKDVRRIYGSRVVVQDDELHKRVQSLQEKCDFLEKREADWKCKEVEWLKKEDEWQKREVYLQMNLHREINKNKERLSDHKGGAWRFAVCDQASQDQWTGRIDTTTCRSSKSTHGFSVQMEHQVDGARFIDLEAATQTLIIVRKHSGVGGRHVITKLSLIYPHGQEEISLPLNVKVVKDMHVSPYSRHALVASLGKKLSVVSLESNNIVLNYDLTVPAWSCSWDMESLHYVYAGLQNGMLLVFDVRQTAAPLESRNGLTCNPIHTICSLSNDSTVPSSTRTLLTASSVGLCEWTIGCGPDKPSMVPETEHQGVCISLAYCPTSDYLAATYRPKIETVNEASVSQPFMSPSSAAGQYVQGSHAILKRMGSCYEKLGSKFSNVPSIRLPRYTIMDMKNGASFASADEMTSELIVQEMPSLATDDRLQSYYPIRDIKYKNSHHGSSLICLSEDKVQFFSQKNS